MTVTISKCIHCKKDTQAYQIQLNIVDGKLQIKTWCQTCDRSTNLTQDIDVLAELVS